MNLFRHKLNDFLQWQRGRRRGPQRGEARRKRRREVATAGDIQRTATPAGPSRTCVQRKEVVAASARQLLVQRTVVGEWKRGGYRGYWISLSFDS